MITTTTALINKINVFLNTTLSEQFQNLIHDIAEILLKVALNTNNQSINQNIIEIAETLH